MEKIIFCEECGKDKVHYLEENDLDIQSIIIGYVHIILMSNKRESREIVKLF